MGKQHSKPRIFVGLGASAGGIEACKALLQTVPADCGAAFVVVLHLDPTRSSHIAHILQTATPHLKVTQANGTERLQPDHVYVIAPNSKLHLADGTLEVDPLAEDEARGGLVDFLFTSLAQAHGSEAVGVVLSGAGHDGTNGLESIRDAGGLCIAQDPESAGSSGMPQSAIDAGVVAAVLPLPGMWPALAAFAADGSRPEPLQGRLAGNGRTAVPDDPTDDESADGFQRILQALGHLADVNFDDYKTGTLARRTRRRMGLKQIDDWDEYADRLAEDRDELDALYQDVLIGVTEFFRDPGVWEHLADELKGLLEQREAPGFRAWIPACGTGEETYSLAILAREQAAAREPSKIQIYATDLNPRALAIARRGLYPIGALKQVAPARREKYFNQRDGRLQVDRSIRDCVTFAPHNVLSDPPFSSMDVVSCRNLLIYLKPPAHDRLLKRLHFALRTGGLLLMGRAERLGRQGRLFEEISKHHSLFRTRAVAQDERFHVTPRTRASGHMPASPPVPSPAEFSSRAPGPDRRVEQFVLRQHTAACAVINADCEIQHLYGRTEQYLVPPTGESRQDLLAWIRSGFYIRLRAALRQAVESGDRTDTEGQIERDGEVQRVQCSISPLPAAVGGEGLFLVTFREVGEAVRQKIEPAGSDEPAVRELEQELHETRRELQAAIEQLETAGEEHRASHEELLSLNEELQSSNEELEASKEELEALNEEMNTINRELEQKNIELREANGDLRNLFVSTGIPTLFLDRELRVRRFTTAATEVMRLVSSDIGRAIEHVKERFDDGSTADRCRQVLETQEPDSAEVRTTDGRYFMRRILPYRTDEGDIDGISITFTDITAQKKATQASDVARDYAEAIIKTARTPLLVLDAELRIESMNDTFRSAFGAADDLVGQGLSDIRDRRWNVPKLDDVLAPVISQGKEVSDYEVQSQDRNIVINARRVEHGDDESRIVLSFEDVSQHRMASNEVERRTTELRQDAERKDQWIAMLGHELRNPVGAVGNGVELLKSGKVSPDHQGQVVSMMDRQIHQVSRLLDELLDAARIVAGKLDIERQPVDLTEVAEWAMDTVGPLMEESQHRVTTNLPPTGTVWVEGDSVRLVEVFGNLLTNAAKYTDAGGDIGFEIAAKDDVVTVRVTDTGIGFPEHLKEHIFEIFTQGPRSLGRSARGLGLGLPLVRSLVNAHDGEVEAFSEGEGSGSEFRITLPRLSHRAEPDSRPPADHEPATSPPRRVLIVDDVQDASESLAMLLRGHGHEARTAEDGPSAVDAARDFKPDVALLDIGLPGMDGYELARRLRDELPDTRLIAITGYQKDTATLEAAGFDHYLLKPINMNELVGLLAHGGTQTESTTGSGE